MSTNAQPPFTIEQFYKFLAEGKLMAGRCLKCRKIHLPPRPLCDNCYSQQFEWILAPTKGKLLTYTIIHIAPPQFKSLAPYAVGIVELENGLRIPGMIQGAPNDKLKVGMALTIDFGTCGTTQSWPQWNRYCFKPA
jgi:uncharacterized OB-fold protein